MKPARFKYIAARSLEEALASKAEYGEEAKFLAGGQSLIPAMNFRLAQPAVLIDINPLAELGGVRRGDGTISIGALTRHRTVERDGMVARYLPVLAEAMPHVAHPQIRNRGTLGGNLANADPASELPAIVLALGGRLQAKSAGGERTIEARAFFVGILSNALEPDEMLVEVELPEPPPGTGACFMEVVRRRGDFAMMGIAAMLTVGVGGACIDAHLAYCGAGDRPIDAIEAAGSLVGRHIATADIREAAALAQRDVDPLGSIHASKDFQRHLAGVLTQRALATALERARSRASAPAEG